MQWILENSEGIIALLTIATMIVTILARLGIIHKSRADVLTAVIEDSSDIMKRTVESLTRIKGRRPTTAEIAKAVTSAMKKEARQRAVKTGIRAVVGALADGAAKADPKEDKKPRPILRRLGSLLRPRIFGG